MCRIGRNILRMSLFHGFQHVNTLLDGLYYLYFDTYKERLEEDNHIGNALPETKRRSITDP